MGKPYKFEIGDWVEFTTYLKVVSQDGHRKAHEIGLAKPKFGQICGAIVRHLGDIQDSEFKYGQNYLIIRKAVILYQVRDGMTNVPFEVREEDLKKTDPKLKRIPWRKVNLTVWARERLSVAAKAQPRDSKGKFIRHHLKAVNE